MKISARRPVLLPLGFLVSAAWAQAHPGHDGHELTWDFSHLAQHPFATMGCAALVGAALCVVLQLTRPRAAARSHSFRGSHANRGK